MDITQKTTTSKDGTTIAYEQQGSGPAIILVSPALGDRTSSTKLAKELAASFTVINYDRRGRGSSTDTQPFAVAREVEDIAALVNEAGGSAYLFGQSSGAVLALEAATALGKSITKLVMFEPPFVVDNSRPPIDQALSQQAADLVAAGKPVDAVKLFYTKVMGLPGFAVTMMRLLMPTWKNIVASAGTLPHDFAVVAGTQDGKPLPKERWAKLTTPTIALVGAKSEPFFHSGAKALAETAPGVTYHSLEGADHGSPTMSPAPVVAAIKNFCS